MTAPYHPFLFGPRGGLVPLPLPESATPNISVFSATNVSINGTSTIERFGVKRSWKFDSAGLTEDQEALITMAYEGVLAGPLYLIDPFTTNLLPEAVATTGSAATPWTISTTSTGLSAEPVASDSSFPITPRHRNVLSLVNSSGASQMAQVSLAPTYTSQVTLSAYVKRTVAGTGGSYLVAADSTGSAIGSAPISSSSWTRIQAAVSPTDGGVIPQMIVAPGASVLVAAVQLEAGPIATAWKPGGGSARVFVSGVDRSSVLWPYRNNSYVVQEV